MSTTPTCKAGTRFFTLTSKEKIMYRVYGKLFKKIKAQKAQKEAAK
jgi:hypothetical protein